MYVNLQTAYKEGKKLFNVKFKGVAQNISYRTTKNGSYLVEGRLYDKNSSLYINTFFTKEPTFKSGDLITFTGNAFFDDYKKDYIIRIKEETLEVFQNEADSIMVDPIKRVEFQTFSFMTEKRGAVPVNKYFERAANLGYPAVGITDLSVVQAFPAAFKAAKKNDVKALYGLTALLISNTDAVFNCNKDFKLTRNFVALDVETTGFSAEFEHIIEIGATKFVDGVATERFQKFLKSPKPIPQVIIDLTKITNEMLEEEGEEPAQAIELFKEFLSDTDFIVGHNLEFDVGHLKAAFEKYLNSPFDYPSADTLLLSRRINTSGFKNHRLGTVASKYGISLENAHRACDDAEATGFILVKMLEQLVELNLHSVKEVNELNEQIIIKSSFPKEISIWARNQVGLKSLYSLITDSHTNGLSRTGSSSNAYRATVTWDMINAHRDGLVIGTGSHNGEVYRAALMKPKSYLHDLIAKYDVVELQPYDTARHLWNNERPEVEREEEVIYAWQKVYEVAKELGKYIIVSSHAHYLDPEQSKLHNILVYSQHQQSKPHAIRKGKMNYPFGPAHFRTTTELMNYFPYLSEAEKIQYISTNTIKLANGFDELSPIPLTETGEPKLFTPTVDNADEQFREIVMNKAYEVYGNPLPKLIQERVERELNSIISNGYAVIYLICRDLVLKSEQDGYTVGSRGSVGSSLAATLSGITEVNPLVPHYVCNDCKWTCLFEMSESIFSGYDLPETIGELLSNDIYVPSEVAKHIKALTISLADVKDVEGHLRSLKANECPRCRKQTLKREGQNIPFETFLGFKGDKIPDVDLNFSGVYQSVAHEYTKVLFGERNVLRAGTISTVADKTAFASTRTYYTNHNVQISNAEIERTAEQITGAKTNTGQHPGGIIVIPKNIDTEDVTPQQYPANKADSSMQTTHFAFEAIHDNLLKLDILGHDNPTVLRYLYDYTGIPSREVPPADPGVLRLFHDAEAVLGINPKDFFAKTGTLGLPEMWTRVTQDVISETSPKTFADLITLSGLTHGTNVYYGNAQDLISNGTCSIRTVIGCRDDIMSYLLVKGLEPSMAFKIMESVRKGKGLTEEFEQAMIANNVPVWYIQSCKLIAYMFPRAHAVAYVTAATRIGWFKLNHINAFYAAIFSARYNTVNFQYFTRNVDETKELYKKLVEEAKTNTNAKESLPAVNLVLEAKMRGVKFAKVDIYKSHYSRYIIDPESGELIPPFLSIPNLGPVSARNLFFERANGPFNGVADLKERTKVSDTNVKLLRKLGCLKEIEEMHGRFF